MIKVFLRRRDVQTALRFLLDFLQSGPIHGLANLAWTHIHWTEFLFWVVTIVGMIASASYWSTNLLYNYLNKNAIITVETSYMLFNTSTPAFTFCPYNILDKDKVAKYISERPLPSNVSPEVFLLFLHQLARTNIANIQKFPILNYDVSPENYMELIFNLSKEFKVGIGQHNLAVKVMTDLGICYTINCEIAETISTRHWSDWRMTNVIKSKSMNATFPKSLSFISDYPMLFEFQHNVTDLSFYLHAPNEIITTWSRKVAYIGGKGFLYLATKLFEITYDEEFIEHTTISQRGCRTPHESNLQMFPATYSRHLCLMECRAQHALKLCHCIPHFYGNLALRRVHMQPICNIIGLNCLSQYKTILQNFHGGASESPFNCSCLPNCAQLQLENSVLLESLEEHEEILSTSDVVLDVEVKYPPITQLKRSVFFTKADFAVSIGSVFSLFLGCSLLSLVDIQYYFSMRIFWFRRGYPGTVVMKIY